MRSQGAARGNTATAVPKAVACAAAATPAPADDMVNPVEAPAASTQF